MSRIFLSHSSVNNAEAIAIRDWMKAQGWDDVFLDLDPERGLVAGDRWQAVLKTAVDRCELVVVVVSPDWAASSWCKAEFLLTKHGSNPKAILPVIVAPTPFSALPSEMTAEYQQVDLTAGTRSVAFDVTLPPGDKMDTVAFSEEGLRRLKIAIERAGVDATYFDWPPVSDPNRPPYRGLKPLEADDAGIFFGRDAPVIEALDRLRGLREAAPPRLLVILGASGAGKSSFLRAGLLPHLKRDDRHFLPLPIVRPDRAVISGETGLLTALEGACRAGGLAKPRAELRAAIDGGAARLRPLLQVFADKATAPAADEWAKDESAKPKAPMLVLSVDQSEELFLAEGQKEAEPFLELLRDLLTGDAPALAALFTIRSDNYERLQVAKGLEGVRQQTLSLLPMPKGSYAEVIKGPSRRLDGTPRALKIEESLVAELLADIEDGVSKDALPLLAFILERLYVEYGASGTLTLAQYRQLGGIQGSIEASVKCALKAADADSRVPKDETARLALLRHGLIPWIAGIDPDSGAPRRRVARVSEIPPEAMPLIERLVEQRLLSSDVTKDGTSTVEPAHEALLRQWDLLRQWLKEDTGLLIVMDGVKRAAQDWAKNRKGEAWITHAAERLKAAEQLTGRLDLAANLEPADREYLATCRKVETAARTRRVRALIYGLFGGILAASPLALAGALWQDRETQRREVSVMTSVADRAIAEGDFERAMRAALQSLPAAFRIFGWPAAGFKIPTELGWSDPEMRGVEARLAGAAQLTPFRVQLAGHREALSSAVFSPDSDGARIVTASDDNTARVWDARTGAELFQLNGHADEVRTAAFSTDGMRIVTASNDKTARVWDVKTQKQILKIDGHGGEVFSAAFSPDDTRIVTASKDGTARIWDAETGKQLVRFDGHRGLVASAAFSPDGKRVVTASGDHTARVWDAESGKEIFPLDRHENTVRRASFNHDGTRIVTASYDKTVRIWDANKGTELVQIKGHRLAVRGAAFSPDDQKIVTASDDGMIRIWDASNISDEHEVWDDKSMSMLRQLAGHGKEVVTAEFSPDGKRIVSASEDLTARVWYAESPPEIYLVLKEDHTLLSASFSPDGKRIAIASTDKTAQVYDAASGRQLLSLKGHEDKIRSLVFNSDGGLIVTASEDQTVRVWDAQAGTEKIKIKGPAPLYGAALSADDRRIVAAAADGAVRVWDATTGAMLLEFKGHDDKVWSAAFSPDGKRIVTASEDKKAKVWDARTGTMLLEFKGSEPVWSAAFSPDGTRIVTGSWDRKAHVWDSESGAELIRMDHPGLVFYAAFSPDGERVITASGSGDDRARIWDARSGALLAELKGHHGPLRHASFRPDGTRVVTASQDMTARVSDARWLATLHGEQLARQVCSERLVGNAQRFSDRDVATDPALGSLAGKDTCAAHK